VRGKKIPKPVPGGLEVAGITEAFAHRMMYSVAKDQYTARDFDAYQGLAYAVRDRLMERWFRTQDAYYHADAKRVYYLSLEFLLGRALLNNVLSLGAQDAYREALDRLGYDLEELQEQEWDAGLGNGGLGRLAACFLESAATLGLPFYGYGIRYEYGIFRQRIVDGFQVETPDNWLRYGNPWEIPRPHVLFPVQFYGRSEHVRHEDGLVRARWTDTQAVYAMAYDTLVAGFQTDNVNTLRLWAAKSSREFDLLRFNAGEYVRAVEDKNQSENISKVLYPPDDQYAGKELRLKQQYFFVSATLQDVLRRFRKRPRRWQELPAKVAVQLNDTHPALAIPELMRLLVDAERVDWDQAWALTQQVFAYTNHTILPEALERWPAELLRRLLPRHFEIIEEIDRRFRVAVAVRQRGGEEAGRKMAILDDTGHVRMAHLAIVGSHSVNGVARLHTEILTQRTFAGFHAHFPGRFNNKTNGITPRRWLLKCNPGLARLVSEAIGDGWQRDLDELCGLRAFARDAAYREQWSAAKRQAKAALSRWVRRSQGLDLDPGALFDCHVKRIHEYKRQLLKALHAITLYHRIREGGDDGVPRVVIFAGKAAPGYAMAKLIIKLIHAVGQMVNGDPATRGRLAVVFLPNYSVSLAERIFPACELSEQISTAGSEASGTGNMKAGLNGALTLGTLDGANVEIRDEVGPENIFIFGHTAPEIETLRGSGCSPRAWLEKSAELRRAVDTIATGPLEKSNPGLFRPVVEELRGSDRYFLCADFDAYVECQDRAARTYQRTEDWNRMSILNVAGMGRFSSDRTVREYAAEIWSAAAVRVELEGAQRPPTRAARE
jgi:starch phosphorylase